MRENSLFCALPTPVLEDLDRIRHTLFYPAGGALFMEGEASGGLFILCAGTIKLTATSRGGKTVTLGFAAPGEAVGLGTVVANTPNKFTAEAMERSEISVISGPDFRQFLRAHGEAAFRVAEHLSVELHRMIGQNRLLSLAPNARARLAWFLTRWADEHGEKNGEGQRIFLNLSQESLGEAAGMTRETVNRLLAELQRTGLIQVNGSAVHLLRPDELRRIALA
jgi:CRP/FNR family transcriptional regulator, cyclic AMP receptor protein